MVDSVTLTAGGLLLNAVLANSNTVNSISVNAGDLIGFVFTQNVHSTVLMLGTGYKVYGGVQFTAS